MPNGRNSGARRSPYLFIMLAAILLLVLIFSAMRAMNAWNAYEAEAAVTPVPTPTVRNIAVTPDPNLITHTPAPSPTPSYLSNGSKGEMVTQMQQRLQELGYYTGIVDGQFGSGTKAAVQNFQRQHGLAADGVAGAQTLGMLYSDEAHKMEANDTLAGDSPLLVNSGHPLPDDFVPADLVTIRTVAGEMFIYEDTSVQGVREAVEHLMEMIEAAKADGVTPWKIREGYRTLQAQQRIFDRQVEEYITERGMTRAQAVSATRQTVADPGSSEHHTGLAFDLNVPGEAFADTAQYAWLMLHCWDYGFIMRYTDDKTDITGILGEEWHVRYVGLEHSQKMKELDLCLEEYVAYLQDQQ